MIQYTSRLSLAETILNLGGLQEEVYNAIKNWNPSDIGPTIEDLARHLERKESSICARLADLRGESKAAQQKGQEACIKNGPLKLNSTGKEAITYKALVFRPEPQEASPKPFVRQEDKSTGQLSLL